jgi:hypothetical protein
MAYTNIPGSAASFPANVRAATGSDPRNATTEAAGVSDLADRTAYLLAWGAQAGSVTDMVNLADVITGTPFTTPQGTYICLSGTLTRNAPWAYTSVGTSGKYWLHQLEPLLHSEAAEGIARLGPLTGIDTITPVGKVPSRNISNAIRNMGPITGATYLAVNQAENTSAAVVSHVVEITDAAVGDKVYGSFGPLQVQNLSTSVTSSAFVRIECVNDSGGANEEAFTVNEFRIDQNRLTYSMTLPFYHVVAVAGVLIVQLRLVGPESGNGGMNVSGTDHTDFNIGNFMLVRP